MTGITSKLAAAGIVVGLAAGAALWLAKSSARVAQPSANESAADPRLAAMQAEVSRLSRELDGVRGVVLAQNAARDTKSVPREERPAAGGPSQPQTREERARKALVTRAEQERIISEAHGSAARDPGWSRAFEPQLRRALVDAVAADGELAEIDCAAISCRVKLRFASEATQKSALARASELPEVAAETFYFYGEEAGRFTTTLFLAREGHSLVKQYLTASD